VTLAPGSRFGVYEVVEPVGAGGMGEVYRARDTRLDRNVALKVLPQAFTRDAERLARFDREARVLASLNHPGIATIHGIEECHGLRALVLEFVEGGTLAGRLNVRRMLTIEETLDVARQIVDALDTAHERGIVHRDLKPSNIGLTANGFVKVLDFGIAKTPSTQLSLVTVDGDQDLATVTLAATRDGRVLGTAAYMSPEQARGLSVDKRADIWAFGCVLFEMLTGTRAFGGPTVSDTVVAILEHEPNWRAMPAGVPPTLRRLMERCLQKDVRRRLRDIGDAHEHLAPMVVHETVRERSLSRLRQVEFQRLTDEVGINESPAISPDGKMVAFVAVVNGRQQVWIRLLTGGPPLQITRDDFDHLYPRWAPDSSSLIYYTPPDDPGGEGALWEVSALGGLPRPIIGALSGGDISHDGRRIALLRADAGRVVLATVARDGSDLRPVTSVARGHFSRLPRWSPDDAWLAFQARGLTVWDEVLWVVPADGGECRPLTRATFMRGVSWLPGHAGLVYSSSKGSTLPYPPAFNLRVASLDGSTDTQITFGDVSFVEPDVHESGRLVACRIRSESDIWKCPVTGTAVENTRAMTPVTRQTGQVQTPSVSPDGSELVYLSDNGGHANLWVIRTDGTRARQITFERDPAITIGMPRWSPAGDAIAYIVNRELPQLWVIRPDGRGARKLVEPGLWPGWSNDGRWLYYTPNVNGEQYTIEKVTVSGGASVLVRGDRNSNAPAVGRDALYFTAFAAPEFGSWDWEIRRASPEDGPSEIIGRVAGGRIPFSPLYIQPALSRDGRWLALGLADGATSNLWMLSTADGAWRQLTDFGDQPTLIVRQVSWSPDSQHLYAAVCKNNGDIVMLDGLV
jgi:eukaryotic-like serine/threonine-protein kinase